MSAYAERKPFALRVIPGNHLGEIQDCTARPEDMPMCSACDPPPPWPHSERQPAYECRSVEWERRYRSDLTIVQRRRLR